MPRIQSKTKQQNKSILLRFHCLHRHFKLTFDRKIDDFLTHSEFA